MSTAFKAVQKRRAQRIRARPDKYRSFVQFTGYSQSWKAQFVDISRTGMRLITRTNANLRVGSRVELEFMLPGSELEIVQKAKVVRRISDFEFAVDFTADEMSPSLIEAVESYRRVADANLLLEAYDEGKEWLTRYRDGILISVVGLVIFAAAFFFIYRTSDEGRGVPLKAWGKTYPKEWSVDYYKKEKW